MKNQGNKKIYKVKEKIVDEMISEEREKRTIVHSLKHN